MAIKKKVTKNIMADKGIILGLTLSQLIMLGIGFLIGIGTFLLLKDTMEFNAMMWIIFLELIVVVGLGVIRIYGMNLFQLILKVLKGADKRPYSNRKGVFDEDDFDIF